MFNFKFEIEANSPKMRIIPAARKGRPVQTTAASSANKRVQAPQKKIDNYSKQQRG